MEFKEVKDLVIVLKVNYPNTYKNFTSEQTELLANDWLSYLSDIPWQIAKMAVQKLKSQEKYFDFPPTIGAINSECRKILNPQSDYKSGEEAYGQVVKAIQNYSYFDNEKAIEMLDETTRKTVQAMGGLLRMRLTTDEQKGTERSQFIRIYESYRESMEGSKLFPPQLGKGIDTVKQQRLKAYKEHQESLKKTEDKPLLAIESKETAEMSTEESMEMIHQVIKAFSAKADMKEQEAAKERYEREQRRREELQYQIKMLSAENI